MAAIHVRAAKITTVEETVFDGEGAGLIHGTPTRALVFGDGKAVIVEGKHKAVKAAIRDGLLIEVKTRAKAETKDE